MIAHPAACRVLLISALVLGLVGPALAADETRTGWIQLFDGKTLNGWEAGSQADWKVVDGIVSADRGAPGLLVTSKAYADYVLKLDFRSTPATNSGVFLRTPKRPTDPAKDCYELNIAAPDVSPFPTGSFVNRQKTSEYRGTDAWQTYEVTAQGGHFVVKLDGQTVLDYRDPQPLASGRIGLQFRSGPISFRNIQLQPLGGKTP